jgi:hypothetical protein
MVHTEYVFIQHIYIYIYILQTRRQESIATDLHFTVTEEYAF